MEHNMDNLTLRVSGEDWIVYYVPYGDNKLHIVDALPTDEYCMNWINRNKRKLNRMIRKKSHLPPKKSLIGRIFWSNST